MKHSPASRKKRFRRELILAVLALGLAYVLAGFPMFTPEQAAQATQTRHLFGPAELLELVDCGRSGGNTAWIGMDDHFYVGRTEENYCLTGVNHYGLFWQSGQLTARKRDEHQPLQAVCPGFYRINEQGFVLFANDDTIASAEVEYISDYYDDSGKPKLDRIPLTLESGYGVVSADMFEIHFGRQLPQIEALRFYGYDISGRLVWVSPLPEEWKELRQ